MTDHHMSAYFTFQASKSDDLFFLNKIVIASRAWRSHSVSLIARDCHIRYSLRNRVYNNLDS